jgi:hypothetical protein
MTRLWDLLDRLVVVLEEGGILKLLREGVEEGERPAFCPFLQDITGFENILNLLIDTALKPIIEDFRAVVSGDPQFRIMILRTSYSLAPFTLDRVSPNNYNLSGLYGRAESAFLVGILELLTSAFKAGISYEKFLNNFVLFILIQKNIRLNQVAKWFNSNPCVDYPQEGNPLLDPGFGILRKEGAQRMKEAQVFALEGIRHLRIALDLSFSERGDPSSPQRMLNGNDRGSPWWTGLFVGRTAQPWFSFRARSPHESDCRALSPSIPFPERSYPADPYGSGFFGTQEDRGLSGTRGIVEPEGEPRPSPSHRGAK